MKHMQSSHHKQLIVLTISMFTFGTIGIVRRNIPLPSDVIAFARGILGGVFLLLYLKISGRSFDRSRIRKRDFLLLILTGALIGFNWILLFEAYNYTTVAIATLCYYMQPVIILLVSPVLLKEKMTVKKTACIIAALIGMILISGLSGGGPAAALSGSGHFRGILFGLSAAVLYASVVLLNKIITGVPVLEKTIIQLFSAALCLLPYMFFHGTLHAYELGNSGILLLLLAGIVHTGIAYVLYFGAVENLPAQTSALFGYIDPVTAVLLSALLLHEPLSASGAAGTILIIGSAIVSSI